MTQFSDDFNRADQELTWTPGSLWRGRNNYPYILNNQVTADDGSISSPGGATYDYTESGVQTSQITIVSLKTLGTSSTVAAVFAGVGCWQGGVEKLVGEDWNIGGTTDYSFYRFMAQTDGFRLRRRIPNSGNFTTLQSSTNYIPQAGDVIKIEYDPATTIIRCRYGINGAAPTINPFASDYDDSGSPDKPPLSNQHVGFWVETDAVVDNWIGTWGTTSSTEPKISADTGQISSTDTGITPIPKTSSDSTLISSSAGGPRPPTKTDSGGPNSIISEDFTAPSGTILYTINGGTKWVTNTGTTPIINNNALTTNAGSNPLLIDSYPGKQSAQFQIKTIGVATGSVRGALVVGAEAFPVTQNPYGNIGGTSGPWYRLHYSSSRYELMIKQANLNTHDAITGGQINITPQDLDVVKLTYDPVDGRVEVFINDMNNAVYSDIPGPPLPITHTRVGLQISTTDTVIDSFVGSWESGQPVPTGPGLYEFFASDDLRPLNPYEVTAINSSTGVRTVSQRDKGKIIIIGEPTDPQPPEGFELIQPIHSDQFLESYGINTGFNRDDIYEPQNQTSTGGGIGRRNDIYRHMEALLIRHHRGKFTGSDTNSASMRAPFEYLADKGIKMYASQQNTANIYSWYPSRNNTGSSWKSFVTSMRQGMEYWATNPNITAVVGMNEPNAARGDGTAEPYYRQATQAWQKEVWDAFQTVPELRDLGIYVAGPALMDEGGPENPPTAPLFGSGGAYEQLVSYNGGIGQYMDRAQLHFYQPGTRMPEYSTSANRTFQEFYDQQLKAAQWLAGASFVNGDLGGVVEGSLDGSAPRIDYTEFGWQHKPSSYSSTWPGYLEDTQVGDLNVMRSIIDPFIRSTGLIPNITYSTGRNPAQNAVGRSFLFDLVDEYPNHYYYSGSGRNAPVVPFGLVSSQDVEKASYISLLGLNLLFVDKSGGGNVGNVMKWTPPKMLFKISYTEPTTGTYAIGSKDNGGLRYRVLARKSDGMKMVLMYRATRPWQFNVAKPGKVYGLPTLNVTLSTIHATTGQEQNRTVAVGGFPIVVMINADNTFNTSLYQNGIYKVVKSAGSLTDW